MDNEIEMKEAKVKIWIYIFIIFASVVAIVWFIYSIYLSIIAIGNDLSVKIYHVLELNENNKQEILSILDNKDINYCNSIYKIEYSNLFPDDYSGKIYCKNEDDIYLSIQICPIHIQN